MSATMPCQPQRLAAHGPIRIDRCRCGQVHMSIGPTTIRLAPAVLRSLGDALRTAVARLEQATTPPLPLQ
jgi:hypothetical protein